MSTVVSFPELIYRKCIYIYIYIIYLFRLYGVKNTKGLLVATNSHKIRTINTNYLSNYIVT